MRQLYVLCAVMPLFFSVLSDAQVGDLDPDFGNGTGHVITNFIPELPSQGYGIAVQQDDKIVVSGYTQGVGGTGYPVLARYLPDGTLDNSFNGNGKLIVTPAGYSQSLIIQPDGKIIQLARIYVDPGSLLGVYRYNPDGSPDNSFDSDGLATTAFEAPYMSPKAIALQPDGKIIVGGYQGFATDTFDMFLVLRYLPDGTPDETWGEDGIVTNRVGESWTDIKTILVQPDGKIIALGYAIFNDFEDFTAVRYNSNGTLDEDFGDDGVAHVTFSDQDDEAVGGALLPDGKIVLGGFAYNAATGYGNFAAARLNADGSPDSSFHGDGMATYAASNYHNSARCMLLQPDGKILLGGYAFLNATGTGGQDMTLVRLTENGIPDITFSDDGANIYDDPSGVSSEAQSMAFQNDGKIVSTGYSRLETLNTLRVSRIISGLILATDDPELAVKNMSVYPNPIAEEIVIEFELDHSEKIAINLCSIEGKLIQRLMATAKMTAGNHQERFTIRKKLLPGSYFVNVETERGTRALMVVSE